MNNTTTTEPDISRLPKWVQEHIGKLNRQRTDAQKELKRLLDTSTESNLYLHSRTTNIGGKFFIQDDSVNFVLPNGGEIEVSLENNELRLMARGLSSQICIKPYACYVVTVAIAPWKGRTNSPCGDDDQSRERTYRRKGQRALVSYATACGKTATQGN